MRVTVDVKGEGTHEIDLEELAPTRGERDGPDEPTYADVLGALEVSPHEVTVLVDGTPVPEDAPVTAAEMTVLRLIKGGRGERHSRR